MTLLAFRRTNFRDQSMDRIDRINEILREFEGQKLTARQVFYQFVSRDWLENTQRNYQNLTSLLTDARYAGLVSWDVIEDRGREPDVPSDWSSIDEVLDLAIRSFRLPRWRDQPVYVELWVEKQALAGVLAPIARRHHVPLVVNKGYSSASAMKVAADRMLEACNATLNIQCKNCEYLLELDGDGRCDHCNQKADPVAVAWPSDNGTITKEVMVLYLGDHDPSGEDMVRDIRDRLTEFGVPNLDVYKLALTMEQIRKFKPPPNPAKITDSRAKAYIAKYGPRSWELDALPPRVLNQLVETAITACIKKGLMEEVIAEEERQRKRLRETIVRGTKKPRKK